METVKLFLEFCHKHRFCIYLLIFFFFMREFSYKNFGDFVNYVAGDALKLSSHVPDSAKNDIFRWIVTGLTSVPFLDVMRKIIKKMKQLWKELDN